MGRDKDLTSEVLKGIYTDAPPADLEQTYLRRRRGKEGGVRLGRGPLTSKDQQIETERMLFLFAISHVAPQVLQSLRDDVLSVWDAEVRRIQELRQTGTAHITWWPLEVWAIKRLPYRNPAAAALLRWAGQHHLMDEWMLHAALETLALWRRNARERKALQWALLYQSVRVPRRMRGVEYTTPMKRARSSEDPLLHYAWLVQFQVLAMDLEQIAQAYTNTDPLGERTITPNAVKKAIASTAGAIGLTRRKS